MPASGKTVAVLGGGISGLTCAHLLLEAGWRPVVFEQADRLAGLGTQFEHDGTVLDCFYHVILDSDHELRALIADLQLSDRLVWRTTEMGFHVGGRLLGFNTPLDILRFSPISFLDRLRVGLGALYITRWPGLERGLDDISCVQWLRSIFGSRVMRNIWLPLLEAKFGDRAAGVPAYWVWSMLNREKHGGPEVKGYLRGGYHALTIALRDAILTRGGEIRLESPVAGLEDQGSHVEVESRGQTEAYDAAISTLPMPLLARCARGTLAQRLPLSDLQYQGVVNALVISRRPLERYYWTVVMEPSFEFQGVVETTHVIPPEWTGGRHLIYLMNYCSQTSAKYLLGDEQVKQKAVDGLSAVYPGFDRNDVEQVYVFRAPHVEPVWTLGYLGKRPAARIASTRVFLSTTAQAYPRVTAWNTSVIVAREVVESLVGGLT